jgi:hypothetical protein
VTRCWRFLGALGQSNDPVRPPDGAGCRNIDHWLVEYDHRHGALVGRVGGSTRYRSGELPVFLKPVIAAELAYFFLGDTVTVVQIAAIFAICACVSTELFWDYLRAVYGRR